MRIVWKNIYICAMAVCITVGGISYLHMQGERTAANGQQVSVSGERESAQEEQVSADMGKATSNETDSKAASPDSEKTKNPKVAITFDDGPHGEATKRLLEGLKERNVKASFFLIGKEIEGEEKLVKQMKEEGHLIGNHTWTHVQLTALSDEAASQELFSTNKKIASVTGEEPEFMRPPFGTISKKVEKKTKMIPILWSVDSKDWLTENADEIVNRVVTQTEDGDIILLHDCYESSVDAALRIIDLLQAQGYEFITADELITD